MYLKQKCEIHLDEASRALIEANAKMQIIRNDLNHSSAKPMNLQENIAQIQIKIKNMPS